MNHLQNYSFVNWAKNIRRKIPHFYQPESEDVLVSIVQKHEKIRIVGTGHSWNEICVSRDALINLDRYDRVLHLDRAAKRVKVQSGIKLSKLNRLLDQEGLALTNLGSIAERRVT